MTRDVHDVQDAKDGGDVRNALASHADGYTVHRQLHAVPPHAVYEVTVDGIRAVCKVTRGPEADPACEARVIQHVGRETSLPVPRVLAVGDDHFVAEWCDGLPGDDPDVDETWARAAGAGLATLHAEASFEQTGLFRAGEDGLALDGHETWSRTLEALLADRRDYLADRGYADVATEAVEFVRDHRDAFDCGVEPVLVHGNYLPDHVRTTGGEVACVIDFEHALAGPAEYDYWRTAMPVFEGSDRSAGGTIREAFGSGYESVRPFPGGLDRRADLCRLVNSVSYLKALYVQREHIDAEDERRAAATCEYARDVLERLRSGRDLVRQGMVREDGIPPSEQFTNGLNASDGLDG